MLSGEKWLQLMPPEKPFAPFISVMSFKVRMVTDDSQLVRILTRREIGNTGRHGCAWVCNSSLFVPQLEGRAKGFMLLSLTCFDSLDSLVALCQPVTESCACYSMILTVSQDNLKWPQRLIRTESPLTHQDRRETCSSCTTKGPWNMVCPNVSKCLKAKRNSLEKSQSLRIHIAISPSTGTKVWKSQMQNLQQWRSQDPLSPSKLSPCSRWRRSLAFLMWWILGLTRSNCSWVVLTYFQHLRHLKELALFLSEDTSSIVFPVLCQVSWNSAFQAALWREAQEQQRLASRLRTSPRAKLRKCKWLQGWHTWVSMRKSLNLEWFGIAEV